MIHTLHGASIIGTLLNSLEAERYMREPLLLTVVDELSADAELSLAADAARSILSRLQTGKLDPVEFAARITALRELVAASTLTAPDAHERIKP